MAAKKRAATGERRLILFGNVKGGKKAKAKKKYILPTEGAVKAFKLKEEKAAPTYKDKNGSVRYFRGEKGGKSIKVPIGKPTAVRGSKNRKVQKYRQIPVPAAAKLTEIAAFVKKNFKSASHFVSPGGRKIPIAKGGK